MARGRRKLKPSPRKTGGEEMTEVKEEEEVVFLDESSSESEVKKLRERWELACVLNFLNVFEPVIGSGLKLTAEEIEMGLLESNSSNAQLHIALLKGIPPVSKLLNGSDAWFLYFVRNLLCGGHGLLKGRLHQLQLRERKYPDSKN